MRIVFANDHLARICTNEAHKLGLPIAVITAARLKLLKLEAAEDERTLRNWKGLYYKKLNGERDGQRSVRINVQYRIVFRLIQDQQPPTIMVLEIDDIH